MPATFPSHQGLVLPLKLWRPRWFDGVALMIGAASPDVAYAFDGSGLAVWPLSHQPIGVFVWCLPVTVVLSALVRRAAPVIAAHLPRGGPFALHDYGALRRSRHRWWVTAYSAVLGAASHLVLDLIGAVAGPVAEWSLHLAGAVATAAVLLSIGRHRLLQRWHGAPPAISRLPLLFWAVAVAAAVPMLVITPYLPAAHLPHTTGVRLLAAASLALLAAAACTTCVSQARAAGWSRDRLPH